MSKESDDATRRLKQMISDGELTKGQAAMIAIGSVEESRLKENHLLRDNETEKMKMTVRDSDCIEFSAKKLPDATGIGLVKDAMSNNAVLPHTAYAAPVEPGSSLLRNLDAAFEKEFGPLKASPPMQRMHERLHGINDPISAARKETGRRDERVRFKDPAATAKTDSANEAWARRRVTGDKVQDYPPTEADHDEQVVSRLFREKGMVLEKPQGSSLHFALDEIVRRGVPESVKEFMFEHFQSFVIHHDWAKAFDHATDFDGGEVRLPFEFTAFEFRITGQRVLVCLGHATDDAGLDHSVTGILLTGVNGRWYMPCTNLSFKDGKLRDMDSWDGALQEYEGGREFMDLLGRQIRAVCIVLEAEVAEVEVVRTSEKMQARRAKEGRLAMKDYHIVNLARRHRVKPPEQSSPSDRRRPRCHFRRGHWRHFAEHRTWIAWMLVGDPDLGFVDKEYRL